MKQTPSPKHDRADSYYKTGRLLWLLRLAVYVSQRIQFHHVGVHSPLARTWRRHFRIPFRSELKYCGDEAPSAL